MLHSGDKPGTTRRVLVHVAENRKNRNVVFCIYVDRAINAQKSAQRCWKRIILLVRRGRSAYKRGPRQKKGHSHAGAARKSREETPKKGCRARDAIACSTGINVSLAAQQTSLRTSRAAQIHSHMNDRVRQRTRALASAVSPT